VARPATAFNVALVEQRTAILNFVNVVAEYSSSSSSAVFTATAALRDDFFHQRTPLRRDVKNICHFFGRLNRPCIKDFYW
jgi:hypothetical protein